MKLSRGEVLHIALLARLSLTEAETNQFGEQLSNILESFKVLQKVDTTGVPPTAQSIALHNIFKNDIATSSLPLSQILLNAPRKEGEFLRVQAIFE
ncbi:Asp-tRNA(Asn)/Glu-tRNA(Gln) amidotransferase subunit GatC [Chloroflexota bacterium]